MNDSIMALFAVHNRKKKEILSSPIFLLIYVMNVFELNGNEYGSISKDAYLSGKFNPQKHELFVEVSGMGIPTNGRKHFLRLETALALKKMYLDFKQAHPDTPFWIQSSTRNFWDQKKIWEDKWNGNTRVEGKKLNQSIPDYKNRAKKILEYSSMPGTSRHHWGSDIDLNKLFNGYYESGDGKILFDWLIQNAADYGFCQPYTAGRSGGYNEERWHWSYKPISLRFMKEWNQTFITGKSKINGFAGWEFISDQAGDYMNIVNSDCMLDK
jgi:LAS superfamily LD-carboxypeptidase LdcB